MTHYNQAEPQLFAGGAPLEVTTTPGTVTFSGAAATSGTQAIQSPAATATFSSDVKAALQLTTPPASTTFDAGTPGISEAITTTPGTVGFSAIASVFMPTIVTLPPATVTFGAGNITVMFVVVEKDGLATLEILTYGAILEIIGS